MSTESESEPGSGSDAVTRPAVAGFCAAGFEGVREAFARNFREHGDVGAAVAVVVDGRTVVDLWGGEAAPGRAWQRDTLVGVFSSGKGLVGLCAHLLAERGELDLDAPVVRYWPEFGRAGKERIPVRWLLSHRSGVIGPRRRLPAEAVLDWDRVCAELAAAEPWWQPGTAHGYHAVTHGFLVGEVVRRITGLTVGAFLRAEVTGPLGADLFIGTPDAEHARCAELIGLSDTAALLDRMVPELAGVEVPSLDAHPLAAAYVALSHLPFADVNGAAFRRAEVPAANTHATARGLAAVYGAAADGRLLAPTTLAALREPQSPEGEPDLVLAALAPSPGYRWSSGFMVDSPRMFGDHPQAFGHDGTGGSLAFADPAHRLGFAYTMNRVAGTASGGDPRSLTLARAAYAALAVAAAPPLR